MLQAELQRLKNSSTFISDYAEFKNALVRSGVLNVMRLLGQPNLIFDGKDANALAAQAARSVGWNGAINTLLNFETLLEALDTNKGSLDMDFGGLERAVKSGDLLPGEADAIRSGKRVDPGTYRPKLDSRS